MIGHVSKIALVLLLLSLSNQSKAHVGLDYPQGGETFIVGETVTIQWHVIVPHNQLNWDLFFSLDGGVTWDTLQLDIPTSTLSYEWIIPDNLTSLARVQVIQDNVDQNYLDSSMDFSIAPNTSPPVLDAPANDIIILCNIDNQDAAVQAWLNNNGGASATNYCGDLIWTNDYAGYSNDCGATGSTLVIFTAEDECGMIITNATMTIADTNPPDIDIPAANLTVETNGQGNQAELNTWLNNQAGAHASDECGDVSWSHNFTMLEDGCGATGSATVIFTVVDACGNNNTTAATFTIVDHLGPALIKTARDTTFDCTTSNPPGDIHLWLTSHAGAEASDVGGDVTWTNNYSGLSDGCGSTGMATVIFMATDECGNSITDEAIIAIEDQLPPVINLNARDTLMECTGPDQQDTIQHWLDLHGGAEATDVCGDVIWINNYASLSDSCGSTGITNVIFTAIDVCGNSTTTEATITIEDNTSPMMEIEAQDTTIVCGSMDQPDIIQNWLNRHGGAVANDLCGSVTWIHSFTALSNTCGPVGTYDIIFTASDECGNASSTNAFLTIVDSITTGVSTLGDFGFTIYPNPASDQITVAFETDEFHNANLEIIDVRGNVLWSEVCRKNPVIIPIQNYSSGLYVLMVRTAKGIYSQKVMVN